MLLAAVGNSNPRNPPIGLNKKTHYTYYNGQEQQKSVTLWAVIPHPISFEKVFLLYSKYEIWCRSSQSSTSLWQFFTWVEHPYILP
jgi:hypothetical protein